MNPSENNALALEYQAYYGGSLRDVDVRDLVNNPGANGVCRVLGLGLAEEGLVTHPDGDFPDKVKARWVVAPGCYEVDRDGKRMRSADDEL